MKTVAVPESVAKAIYTLLNDVDTLVLHVAPETSLNASIARDLRSLRSALDTAIDASERPLKVWTVPYVRIPTMRNDTRTMIVEAASADDAREIVRDRLGDRGNPLPNYDVGGAFYGGAGKITEYVAPPSGRVIS